MYHLASVLPYFAQQCSVVTIPFNQTAKLCQPNPYRCMLYLAMNATSTIQVFSPGLGSESHPQFTISQYTYLRFTWTEDGPMSTLEWWASLGTGVATVVVTEVLWQPP